MLLIRHRAPARSVCGFRLLSSQLDSSKILDSEQNILLEDSKDPPKTASAADMPLGPPTRGFRHFTHGLCVNEFNPDPGVFGVLHMAHV